MRNTFGCFNLWPYRPLMPSKKHCQLGCFEKKPGEDFDKEYSFTGFLPSPEDCGYYCKGFEFKKMKYNWVMGANSWDQ